MEQRKSDINTGDGNVVNVDTNGLSYSFDFSSQVEPANQQNVQQPQVMPSTPEPVQPQVVSSMPASAGSQVIPGTPEPVQPQVVPSAPEPVQQPQVVPSAPEPVQQPQVMPSAPEPVQQPQVMPSAPESAGPQVIPGTPEPVQPSVQQPESLGQVSDQSQAQSSNLQTQVADKNESDVKTVESVNKIVSSSNGEELIKDKKSTKRFLIAVVIIIVAFVIALPFIFKILG